MTHLISGFPRSGNVYLSQLSNGIFTQHSIKALSIPNTLVPIREPIYAISSWVNLTNNTEGTVKYFIRFYQHILENIQHLTIISFESMVNNCEDLFEFLKVKNKKANTNHLGAYSLIDVDLKQLNICNDLYRKVYSHRSF